MATHATHTLRPGKGRHAGSRRRIRIDEHLPVDHRLSRVYRIGAGLMGLFLLVFGVFGLIDKVGWFDTNGDEVVGLSTNGTLSVLSIAVGLLLLVGMVIGGNFASTLNMTLGVLFILSGFANMALLDTDSNFLAFRIQNVLFSFVVGILLMTFGMYGRVGTALPHDNPYWRARHPEEAERETRRGEGVGMAKRERADTLPDAGAESATDTATGGKGAG
ncbi:DUF4383 domain-containing protein [Streptomyces sp. MB09-02B]|uniref:DUF4383 domain-containing protein n=1 Tax=Streptomyces sp. MB09-02B TaxID=3028667 RepID=UPI0029A47016|nr:DUF4383 domain-containing protein [Streptomyces sp. MB09-02B]MDX3642420.1 DUF4383 domain-containing protein [Streptomyces sp. MB09-02B]